MKTMIDNLPFVSAFDAEFKHAVDTKVICINLLQNPEYSRSQGFSEKPLEKGLGYWIYRIQELKKYKSISAN